MPRYSAACSILLLTMTWVAPFRTSAAAQGPTGVREVTASERAVISIQTRLRYTTMIVLPQEDEILDVICGDKDFWVISATQNVAHVKPAKERATTNLSLVTRTTIYTFLVSEKDGKDLPDLMVFVNADASAPRGSPKYYSARDIASLETELREARATIEAAQRRAADAIAAHQQNYPTRLQFAYGSLRYEKPFWVRALWHDGQRTYIKTDARELPALYQVQDGKPALVDYQVHDGTYVVSKVLDQGYLALGKARFDFSLRPR